MIKQSMMVMMSVALFMSGCTKISGNLTVENDLAIKVLHKDAFGGGDAGSSIPEERIESVKPGRYDAAVEYRNARELVLKIKLKKFDTKEVVLSVPEGKSIPEFDGEIQLLAAESNQPFDLVGRINGKVTYSDTHRAVESCTYLDQEYVCHIVPADKRREGGKEKECKWETVTRTGHHDVEFHYTYTDRDIALEIMKAGTSEKQGSFSGNKSETDKVYTFQGTCQPDRGHHGRPPRY